jgi:hypothetical protein
MTKKSSISLLQSLYFFYGLLVINLFAIFKTENPYNTSIFIAALGWIMFGTMFYIIIEFFLWQKIYIKFLKLNKKLSHEGTASGQDHEINVIGSKVQRLNLIIANLRLFMTSILPIAMTVIGLTLNYFFTYHLTKKEGLIYQYSSLWLMIIAFIGTYLYLSQKCKEVKSSIMSFKTHLKAS